MSGYNITNLGTISAGTWTGGSVYIGGLANGYNFYYSGGTTINCSTDYKVNGIIYATGDIYANYSDIRLKENIQSVENALDIIKKIRAVTFNWNDNKLVADRNHSKDIGFIAQEVDDIFPLAVAPFADSGYFTVDKTKMIPLILEGIKENASEIDKLKDRVRQLELENKELKRRLN